MKKTLTAATLAIATALAGSALAQPPGWGYGPGYADPQGFGAQPSYGPGSGMGLRRNPQAIQDRVQRMSQALGLSDSQKTEIRSILEERRAGAIGSRDATHARIAAVLDQDQRAKLDQWRANRQGGGYGPRSGMGYGPGGGYGPGMGRGMGYGPGSGYGPGPFGTPQN